jgi:hypothetical protein
MVSAISDHKSERLVLPHQKVKELEIHGKAALAQIPSVAKTRVFARDHSYRENAI